MLYISFNHSKSFSYPYSATVHSVILLLQSTSNGLKLYKNRFNTAIRGHSFSQRIVNDWNTLPHEIVSAPNVLIFKTKVDVFLYDRRFDFI